MSTLKNLYTILLRLIICYTFVLSIYAAKDLAYPELMVTPKASTRLHMEARKEASQQWSTQLPLQVSSISTLVTGLVQTSNVDKTKDPDNYSAYVGIIAGGLSTAANYYYASRYQAFSRSYREIKRLPHKTKRQKLIRERLAEERINQIAATYTRLKWISFGTNFGASIYMASKAQSGTLSKPLAIYSALAAITPLIFSTKYEDVAAEQKAYKKKIYAPVVSTTLLYDKIHRKYLPGAMVSMQF